nr:suppressor of fused domain protein [uncultured Dyadobacter sp.]
MLNFFKNLFRNTGDQQPKGFSDSEFEQDYNLKSKGLEDVLGEMYDLVGHAIIPYQVGGTVDMYYFPNHIPGTGFATMELLQPDGTGPLENRLGTYELVAFTKLPYDSDKGLQTPFDLIERRLCGIFTTIARFSEEAVLNPGETCEVPNGDNEENTCLVFDLYEPDKKQFVVGNRKHHLLLCILLFRSEMEYAREYGSDVLLKMLKAAGHYPYSDLDREPVA